MAIATGTAMLASAAIGTAGTLIASNKANNAAKDAARSQQRAADTAYANTQTAINDYSRANPYIQMGSRYGDQMTGRLAGLMGYGPMPSTPPAAGSGQGLFGAAGSRPAGAQTPRYIPNFGNPNAMSGIGTGLPGGFSISGRGDGSYAYNSGAERLTNKTQAPGYIKNGQPEAQLQPPAGGSGGGSSLFGSGAGAQQGGDSRTEFLRNTPGYQFAYNEGINAVQQSLGAQNNLYSGKAMKDLYRWAQGYSDQQYDAALDREYALMDRVGQGHAAVLSAQTGNEAGLANAASTAANTRLDGKRDQIAGIAGAINTGVQGLSDWATRGNKKD